MVVRPKRQRRKQKPKPVASRACEHNNSPLARGFLFVGWLVGWSAFRPRNTPRRAFIQFHILFEQMSRAVSSRFILCIAGFSPYIESAFAQFGRFYLCTSVCYSAAFVALCFTPPPPRIFICAIGVYICSRLSMLNMPPLCGGRCFLYTICTNNENGWMGWLLLSGRREHLDRKPTAVSSRVLFIYIKK